MTTREIITSIVEALVGPRLDMRAAYPARVVTQHADGTLDVIPDSAKVPSLTRVPIRYGIPGVTCKVKKDARVLIEFAAGDPDQPFASVWESASVSEVTVKADVVRLADGDVPFARLGDLVQIKLPTGAAGGTAIVWTSVPDPSPLAVAYGVISSASGSVKGK